MNGGPTLHRLVLEQVDEVIFLLDTEGRWALLNPAWHALTGRDVAGTIGQPVIDSLHPDDRADTLELVRAMVAGARDSCRCHVRFTKADGGVCWSEVRARTFRQDDAVAGIVGTIIDVAAARQVQLELEGARTAAERASAARGEFLRAMSHGMRTPLNGVLGLIELLAATPLDAQQARYVSVARASASHLSALIDDILDLSRIEDGALVLERTLFDLSDLLESTVDAVAAEASARGLQLSCTLTPDVPTWVVGDPGRLRQILVHLLSNAVAFTQHGEVHLQADADVDLRLRTASLRLDVQDTGVGIAPEQLERLFLPYTPGDASGLGGHGPTGLGLTICKRLVEAMKGTIAVRSVPGEGATFTVTVSVEVADAALVETSRASDAPQRVLAVLRDGPEREMVAAALETWRFDALVVASCDAAWMHVESARASRARFAVVVVDGAAIGAAGFARQLGEIVPRPGIVWILPEQGGAPLPGMGPCERVARPVKPGALFDAIMQALVGATTADAAVQGLPPSPWSRPPVVLVAEDHEVNQVVIEDLLVRMGCEVDLAADGEQAVAAAGARRYDAILMDCQMPVVDGLEATRRIRRAGGGGSTTHAPRIIALTANASPDDRQACFAAGMDAYLTKPVRPAVLQRTLVRLLAERSRSATPPADTALPAPAPLSGEETPADEILDPAELLLRCNHNGDLGARMLQLFAASLPSELASLEAAAERGDVPVLSAVSHKMRGAAATLAAVRLTSALTAVERFIKYGEGGPLPALVASVRQECALLLGAVPEVVRRLMNGPSARAT